MAFAPPLPKSSAATPPPLCTTTTTSSHHHTTSTTSHENPCFLHDGKVMRYEGNIFDKLNDPTLFTGTSKHRFDRYGRGLGLAGRREEFELLDSGVLFDAVATRHHSGSSGDASDRAESLWMKSLRAAMYSPSLAKQLQQQSSGTSGGVIDRSSRYQHRQQTTNHEQLPAAAPLMQAWTLGSDGRLVYDDQRTRELLLRAASGGSDEGDVEVGAYVYEEGERGGRPYDPPRYRTTSGAPSNKSMKPKQHQQNQPAHRQPQPERAMDVRKRRGVSDHMRKLLYDDVDDHRTATDVGGGVPRYTVRFTDGDEDDDDGGVHQSAGRLPSSSPSIAVQQQGRQPYDPREGFRRWTANDHHAAVEDYGDDDDTISLMDTMAGLDAYDRRESAPHERFAKVNY